MSASGYPFPAEAGLLALAQRFAQADAEIRALVARAAARDRASLLAQALAILTALRARAHADDGAIAAVLLAYLTSALATQLLTGRPAPDGARALRLGHGLALGLDRGIVTAQQNTRQALLTVTEANVEEKSMDALTARVDRAGARRQLGAEATMRTQIVGRHASVHAVADVVGPGGRLKISDQASPSCNFNGICRGFAGQTVTVGAPRTRLPPFHPHCSHFAVPAGVTEYDYIGAQHQAAATLSPSPSSLGAVARPRGLLSG